MAGRPHQRREIVAVARIRGDTGVKEPPHDIDEAARGRISDRRLAGASTIFGSAPPAMSCPRCGRCL